MAAREASLAILANLPDGEAWLDRVKTAYAQRRSLSALAHYATPGVDFDRVTNQGTPFRYHVFGAALVEADVLGLPQFGIVMLDEWTGDAVLPAAVDSAQALIWLDCTDSFIDRWNKRFVAERLAGLFSRHAGQEASTLTPALEALVGVGDERLEAGAIARRPASVCSIALRARSL